MQLYQLLTKAKRSDIAAQKTLYEVFAANLFLLCRRYVKTDEEAEEVLMNGFLKFFNALPKFTYTSDAAAVAWLKKIMVNECLMHLRRTNCFLQVVSGLLPETEQPEDVVDALSAEEIFVLITQLPVGYRTVFNLFVMEGMSHKEIAGVLSISQGTSRSQLNKARQLLQQLLIQKNGDHAWRKTK